MLAPQRFLIIGAGKTGGHVPSALPPDAAIDIATTRMPLTEQRLADADAVIVFVPPAAMPDLIDPLLDARLPAVIGTTGVTWPADLDTRLRLAQTPWLVGSNFSLGMNLMFLMAELLGRSQQLAPEAFVGSTTAIHETHHIHKKDKPSGSALRLRDAFVDASLPITAERTGDVAGHHELRMTLPHETLTVTHDVADRAVFAQGAAWAAQHLLPGLPAGFHRFEDQLRQHLRNQHHESV
ncbi:MAG: dihydrodipicolinate reductase C-terminal domain-containing protein [Phycisphaeraceae bacterium]